MSRVGSGRVYSKNLLYTCYTKELLPFDIIVKRVNNCIRDACFKWVEDIETHESEVVNPNQLKSEPHVNVDVVNMLDCSLSHSNNDPEESDVVGWLQFENSENHPVCNQNMHKGIWS